MQKKFKDRRHSKPRKNGYGGNGANVEKARSLRGKYLEKAKDAMASGDRIAAEYYFQYADHYSRQIDYYTPPASLASEVPASVPDAVENDDMLMG